jgi:hypothetical protein
MRERGKPHKVGVRDRDEGADRPQAARNQVQIAG